MTHCSTAFAVLNAGFKPVLVDIDKILQLKYKNQRKNYK